MAKEVLDRPKFSAPASLPGLNRIWTDSDGNGTGIWKDPQMVGVPSARAYASAATAVATATWASIALAAELHDTGGLHDTVTNNTRITIVTPGLYLVTGHVTFGASTAGTRRISELRLNGSTVGDQNSTIAREETTPGGSANLTHSLAGIKYLNAGDFVELAVYQDSGASMNIGTNPPAHLAVAWLGTGNQPTFQIARQAADVTQALAAFVNTDLVFTFEANATYMIDMILLATAAAATTGFQFAFDVSAAVTAVGLDFEHQLAAGGTVTGGHSVADDTAASVSSGVPTAGALVPISARGLLVSGANTGTCRLRFAPEVAASATFKAGSVLRAHRVA